MILVIILCFPLMLLSGLAGLVALRLQPALATPLFWLAGCAAMTIVSALILDFRINLPQVRRYRYQARRERALLPWGYCQDCGQFAQLGTDWRDPYCQSCLKPAQRAARKLRKRRQHLAAIDQRLEQLRQAGQCAFLSAWCDCTQPLAEGSDRCQYHQNLRCVVCQAPAQHECDAAGSLVCGTPLCREHTCRQHDRDWYS